VFCEVDRVLPYGTHAIVIAKVTRARSKLEISPLLYLDGAARNVATDEAQERPTPVAEAGAKP
jgi:flavin reductase (DIM6/NTAB) family NADH-FMN oxidoreductase RutF